MSGWISIGGMYKDNVLPIKRDQELEMKGARLGLFPKIPEEYGRNCLHSKKIYL